VVVVSVGGDQFRESVGVRARRCDSLEDETNAGLSEVQAPLVIVVGIVGFVLPVEIRDVVAIELDEPPTLQHVESADHTRTAKVERAAPRLVVVFGMQRPTVVEGRLGLGDDLANRRLDRGSVPGLVEERFVALGVEESQR